MGAVAGAEPASEIARFADGDASEVGADACMTIALASESVRSSYLFMAIRDGRSSFWWEEGGQKRTQHDQPFRLLHPIRIRLGISQALPFGIFGFLDFIFCAVTNEDGLPSPFDDNLSCVSHK